MRRSSSITIDPLGKGTASYWYCLFLVIIIGILCIPCSLFMIFMPDERVEKIELYNYQAALWNNTYLYEMKKIHFSLTVNDINFSESVNESIFGEFYPYRDSCSKSNDPECFSPAVHYKSFMIPAHISNNPSITLKYVDGTNKDKFLMNTNIPISRNITMTATQLGCNPDGDICTKRCKAMSGYWMKEYAICIIESYLNRICMRVRRASNSSHFELDHNPLYPMGKNSNIGCEMYLANNTLLHTNSTAWLPFYYTTQYVKEIPFILYHAGDAYIRAGAITDNCSSSHLENADCFQRGKSDYTSWTVFCSIYGWISLIIIIVLNYLNKKEILTFIIWENYLNSVDRRRDSEIPMTDDDEEKKKTMIDPLYPPVIVVDGVDVVEEQTSDNITASPTGI